MAMEKRRDQRTPTESDLSGSNYSETEREARKRKGAMEGIIGTNGKGEGPLSGNSRARGQPCKGIPRKA